MIRGRRHDADLLAELFDGETRQVWALQPDGQRFYLSDGGAMPELRERARAGELICPVPECGSPAFRVRGGSRRRHHFVHVTRPTGGHSPETIFHIQAKAALVAWARAQQPNAVVVEEFRFDGGERVADVLVTLPAGERVAFEVQYSRLAMDDGPRSWLERHRWYAHHGITDVWLFAPQAPHLTRPDRPVDLPVDEPHRQAWLGPLQKELAAYPHPILWFNPESKKVATPIVQGNAPGHRPDWWRPEHLESVGPRRPQAGDTLVDLFADELDQCILTPTGILTPTDQWLAGQRDELSQKAKEAEEASNRESARRAPPRTPTPAAQPSAPQQEISPAEPTPPTPIRPVRSFLDVKLWHTRPLPAWDDRNPDWQWLSARHGDQLPAVLTEPHPCEQGIGAPLLQWRTAIYRHLINLAQESCCEGDAIEALFQLGPAHEPALMYQAATDFYRALTASRLIERRISSPGPRRNV